MPGGKGYRGLSFDPPPPAHMPWGPAPANPRDQDARGGSAPGRRGSIADDRNEMLTDPQAGAQALEDMFQDREARSKVSGGAGLWGNQYGEENFGTQGLASYYVKQEMEKLRESGQAAGEVPSSPAPRPSALGTVRKGRPPAQGGLDPLSTTGRPQPTSPTTPRCPPVPEGLVARWQNNPQTSRGEGPGAPIPVPFGSGEVRDAVRWAYAYQPLGTTCLPAPVQAFIARKTAQVLATWGPSRGWVRIRLDGGPPRTFNLVDKVYTMERGRPSLTARDTAPPGVIPVDLDTATTTWDTDGYAADPLDGAAFADEGRYWPRGIADDFGSGNIDASYAGTPVGGGYAGGFAVGDGFAVAGARPNIYAQYTDTVGAAMAMMPYPVEEPRSYSTRADVNGGNGLNVSLFPVLQTHSIKG